MLISALSSSFFRRINDNPKIPENVSSKAQVELAAGIPFVSDKDLKTALDKADVPPLTADQIVNENETARLGGLRAALSVLAVIALIAVFFSRRIPTRQPGASTSNA